MAALVLIPSAVGLGFEIVAAVATGIAGAAIGALMLFKRDDGGKEQEPIKPDDFNNRGDGGGPDGGDHDPKLPRWYHRQDRNRKGPFIQKDRAGGRAHGGGDQYKLFDPRGKRLGTLNSDGKFIRP